MITLLRRAPVASVSSSVHTFRSATGAAVAGAALGKVVASGGTPGEEIGWCEVAK